MKNSETPIHPDPYTNQDGTIQRDVYFGLTKREHFAIEILKSNIIAENEASAESCVKYLGISKDEYNGYEHWFKFLSKLSIDLADTFIDELERSDS